MPPRSHCRPRLRSHLRVRFIRQMSSAPRLRSSDSVPRARYRPMSVRPISVFAGLLCLALTQQGAAQTTVATTPAGGTPITLEAVGGGDPFAATLPTPVRPEPTAVITTNVGFSYLRPYWAGNGLS